MFHATVAKASVARGNFFSLFTNRKRFVRYLAIICVGVPVWYVIGILFTFAPELGGALGLSPAPKARRRRCSSCYAGCSVGGMASGLLCQYLKSRKKTLGLFLVFVTVMVIVYFTLGGMSLSGFYVIALLGGISTGYWAVFVSTSAELFGTNLRATVATTVPNFVRGSVVLVAMLFTELKGRIGLLEAAGAVGALTLVIAFAGLLGLHETFGVDLDYVEDDDRPQLPKVTAVG